MSEPISTTQSSQETIQDIYSEPKFLKRKRKKEVQEGIENPVWNPTTGSLPSKQIISSIVPLPINNLEKNYQTKVHGRHIALHRSHRSQSNNGDSDESAMPEKSRRSERQAKFLELEQLIQIEQTRYKYENFVPLHQLWLGYMSELLEIRLKTEGDEGTGNLVPESVTPADKFKGIPSVLSIQSKLLKADYHGAQMTVKQAKNPSLVGLEGIMIQESEQTFKIIDSKNRIKLIPKLHCVFQISLPLLVDDAPDPDQSESKNHSLVFNIFGNQFAFRPTERINKKFKSKGFFEL